MNPSILIVDDDAHIRQVVRFALERAGFDTFEVGDGRAALSAVKEVSPDLMILDVLMPEMDGTEVCRRVRAESTLPIVFLTSVDDEVDRILGLELGGDDYVTKPFSPRELVARVRAVLRRHQRSPSDSGIPEARLRYGTLTLDDETFEVAIGGEQVVLTATEFALLKTLLRRPRKVYSRGELMDYAYGPGTIVSDRTIDSHVRRIRRKLGAVDGRSWIETVHGVGYRMQALS